jgi:hypothetical protein
MGRAQMGLSGDCVFRYLGEWGHDLPIRRPAMVVEEVRGLLRRMGCDSERKEKMVVEEDVRRGEGKDRGKVGLSPAMSFMG